MAVRTTTYIKADCDLCGWSTGLRESGYEHEVEGSARQHEEDGCDA